MDVRLLWDGEQVFWSYGEDESWLPLSGTDSGAAQFPGFAATFDAMAPDGLRGYSPPFLTALPELGGVQSGPVCSREPALGGAWQCVHLLIFQPFRDWSPGRGLSRRISGSVRFLRMSDSPEPVYRYTYRAQVPFLQVQPIPQLAYREEILAAFVCSEASHLTSSDWDRLGDVLLPHPDQSIRQGSYAVMVRKRRMCPLDHTVQIARKSD